MSLFAILVVPLLALAVCAVSSENRRIPALVTVIAAAVILIVVVDAAFTVAGGTQMMPVTHWVGLDGLGALVLLVVAFTGFTAALFSVGYMGRRSDSTKRVRSYYIHFNLFLFALLLVPVVRTPILAWLAIELTALFSVLLVAFDNTHTALEAAWKYIAMTFMGAAIALLGFLILFWAFDKSGGGVFCWDELHNAAGVMSPVLVKSAFLLILIGLGTEVGLVPLHTWLPDAHSQAPSPACALLSGVKTTVALLVILRIVPLLPAQWIGPWLIVIGLVSAGTAAFLLLQVRDYKRLFAFSTVEHMGIIMVAAGFGTRAGDFGAMFQILTHSVTKSFCFLAAGIVLIVVKTRQIDSARGLIRRSPVSAAALLFGALAIAGAPPAAVFLSEFSIFKAGIATTHYLITGVLVFFIMIAFFGILFHINRMVFGQAEFDADTSTVHLPKSCIVAVCIAAVPVLVCGVYLPGPIHQLIQAAAAVMSR